MLDSAGEGRIGRPPTIDGIDVDEFIQRNADPIWLRQNELWEEMESEATSDVNDLPSDSDLF